MVCGMYMGWDGTNGGTSGGGGGGGGDGDGDGDDDERCRNVGM